MIYFSYDKRDEIRVKQVLNEVYHLEISLENIHFQHSHIYLFFVTNDYLETNEFKMDLERAKIEEKLYLIIFIEMKYLEDFDEFMTSSIYPLKRIDDCEENRRELIKSEIFLRRISNFDHSEFNNNLINTSLLKVIQHQSYGSVNELSRIDVLSISNEVIINIEKIRIFNFMTGILKDVSHSTFLRQFCWIDHLNLILVVSSVEHKDPNSCLIDKDGKLIREFFIQMVSFYLKSITYEAKSRKTYFYGFDQSSEKNSILVLNENFLHERTVENYTIKDISLNLSNLIEYNNLEYSIFDYPENADLVFLQTSKWQYKKNRFSDIYLFNKKTCSVVDVIQTNLRLVLVMKNKLLLTICKDSCKYFSTNNYYICKFFMKQIPTTHVIDSGFICKLNPYKPHLINDPCILPCGNSACFKCICSNYNLYTRNIACNFESCQLEHKLNQKLEKNVLLINNIRENSAEIGKVLFKLLEKGLENSGKYIFYCRESITRKNLFSDQRFEELNNKFEYLDHLMNMRVESIGAKFDQLEDRMIHKTNLLEIKLLSQKKYFFSRRFFKLDDASDKMSGKKLGFFNNIHNLETIYKETRGMREPLASVYKDLFKIMMN